MFLTLYIEIDYLLAVHMRREGKKYIRAFSLIGLGIFIILLWLVMRGIVEMPMEINFFNILHIRLYALAILGGVGIATLLGKKFVHGEKELAKIDLLELLLFLLIPGVIGARLYHVVTDFQLYQNNLANILAIWNGGLGIPGGLIAGLLGLYFYCKRQKVSFERLLAVIVTVVPVAQMVGRLGNLVNQELYGPPTDLPWGVYILPENRLPGYESFSYFHPLFLYEALGNLVLFALLYRAYKRGEFGPRLLGLYVGGYGIIRYLLDFLRLEGVSGVYGLSYTQWGILGLYLAAFVFGVVYQIWHRRKYGKWFTRVDI